MNISERSMPPLVADERTTLESWLDFYRATLVQKCAELPEERLREAAVAPSSVTLLGLVQHAAAVERNWFRRVLVQEDVPRLYAPADESGGGGGGAGHDGGFELAEDATYESAVAVWEEEVRRGRENSAGRKLDDTSPFMGGEVTLRWIYAHMIGEYARHCGHADLIRERIDGSTGV
ncbi:DinB family protein [Streptomyces cyaneofuscatus]|uniref:DinB family protein n=1 Tax=Streptomyces TaxID=1883 RepID=UPI000476415E|nr:MULTISPECIES: DinB family protein [unclassified Streptomyces]